MNQISSTGECPKSVKLLIMQLSITESGCLVALKGPRIHLYVSVNSLPHAATEAPCCGIFNMKGKKERYADSYYLMHSANC